LKLRGKRKFFAKWSFAKASLYTQEQKNYFYSRRFLIVDQDIFCPFSLNGQKK
jgi:hypothetical protein